MRLAVVGTGLIGASVGLAARRTGFAEWLDSEEMFLRLFREMRERRIIPT